MCRLVNVKTNFNTEIEVADIKKEVVENIIEAAGVCSRICQIILFGSVIESRCTEGRTAPESKCNQTVPRCFRGR